MKTKEKKENAYLQRNNSEVLISVLLALWTRLFFIVGALTWALKGVYQCLGALPTKCTQHLSLSCDNQNAYRHSPVSLEGDAVLGGETLKQTDDGILKNNFRSHTEGNGIISSEEFMEENYEYDLYAPLNCNSRARVPYYYS